MKLTFNTCGYAVITLVAECSKRNRRGENIHAAEFCPEEMTCPYREQADECTLAQNAIYWSIARIIEVD